MADARVGPRVDGVLRWNGDHAARRAVYNNRARLLSGVAREAFCGVGPCGRTGRRR
jgi:hypothetical protein